MSYPSRAPAAVADRHDEVERLTRTGLKIREICRETGLSRTSVVRVRSARDLSRPIRSSLSKPDVEHARRMLDDGASIAEIVRTIGCGRSQIDDRFPGCAWTLPQTLDYLRTLRQLAGNHSADQIDAMWAAKKSRRAAEIKAEFPTEQDGRS